MRSMLNSNVPRGANRQVRRGLSAREFGCTRRRVSLSSRKKTHTTAGYTSVSVAVPRCGCPWDSVCQCLCCYLCVCLLFFSVCLFLCLLFISLAPFVIETALRTAHKHSFVSLWLMQISRPLKSKAPCHTPPQLFQATNPEQQSRDTSLSLACLFCSRQSTSYQSFF